MNQAQLASLIADSLSYAKSRGADEADAFVSSEQGFSVDARAGAVESIEYHQEQSYTISFYREKRCASLSTTELTMPALKSLIDKAANLVGYADPDPYAGLPDKALLASQYPDCELFHPWDITPELAMSLAAECDTIARDQDVRITDSEGASVSTYTSQRVYGNTLGFVGGYPSTRHMITSRVVAKDQSDMQTDYDYSVARDASQLADVSVIAKHAANKAVQRLHPRQIKTQRCPVIFSASEAKSLLGSFIAAISGGNIFRKNSFLLDKLNTPVFPNHISIFQQPHLVRALGSRPFDQEGVATRQQFYVEDGQLLSYLLGSYSARRLGLQSTGNAGGVFNLGITHSDHSLASLCKEMGTGLLVTDLIGQGVRIISGDYSRGASGYWIENGEVQYPVSEITIAGNLKDMFQGILAIGNDVDMRGNIRTGSIWVNEMMVAGKS